MSVVVDFYHDLASPNAYLSNKVLKGILARTGATVKYRPILLGGVFKATNNQAPWITYAPVKPKMDYMMVELRYLTNLFHQINQHLFQDLLTIVRIYSFE